MYDAHNFLFTTGGTLVPPSDFRPMLSYHIIYLIVMTNIPHRRTRTRDIATLMATSIIRFYSSRQLYDLEAAKRLADTYLSSCDMPDNEMHGQLDLFPLI